MAVSALLPLDFYASRVLKIRYRNPLPCMAITAVIFCDIPKKSRVCIRAALIRYARAPLLLVEHFMTDVAVVSDDFLRVGGADVFAIVAAETPLNIIMSDIIGMTLPVNLHFRKEVRLIDALNLHNSRL